MWKKLDMLNEENFNFFLNFMSVYTCALDHHDTYGITKMKNLLHPVRIEVENIGVFYYEDENFQIMIGVMNHAKDENTIWAWSSESRGIETIDELIQHTHIYFQFIRDYLINNQKTKWTSGISWKDFNPSYKINFEDSVFWEKFEAIGHEYLDFELELENPLVFELKDVNR